MPLPAGTIRINYQETESVTALAAQIQSGHPHQHEHKVTPSYVQRAL